MANIDVTITKVSPTLCTLNPPQAVLAAGDTVTWINKTGSRVIVFFPHDGILGGGGHFLHPISNNASFSPPALGTVTKRPYKYALYCSITKSFAIGSDPELIVQ